MHELYEPVPVPIRSLHWCRIVRTKHASQEEDMEKLIDLFCHAIRITDPLSIKIAVGVMGGGLPLLVVYALLIMLGEIAASQREATTPPVARPKRRPGRRSASVEK